MTSTLARRRGLLAVVLLLFATVPLDPAAAQAPASPPAQAPQDPYTATVTVDATSDDVAKARDIARLDGARRALAMVVQNLAGGPDKTKPLKLGDNDVTNMVASFEVANEKMSAVRYTADYTYHFKPADVAKAMQTSGIAINNAGTSAASTGRAIVVLPVYQDGTAALLWDDPNPWRDAWAQRAPSPSGVPLLVPLAMSATSPRLTRTRRAWAMRRRWRRSPRRRASTDVLVHRRGEAGRRQARPRRDCAAVSSGAVRRRPFRFDRRQSRRSPMPTCSSARPTPSPQTSTAAGRPPRPILAVNSRPA